MNCCDAMRRLSDAWRTAKPDSQVALVDLPVMSNEGAISFFAGALEKLSETLSAWSGHSFNQADISASIAKFDEMADLLGELTVRAHNGSLQGGSARLQELFNRAATEPIDRSCENAQEARGRAGIANSRGQWSSRVPFRQRAPGSGGFCVLSIVRSSHSGR